MNGRGRVPIKLYLWAVKSDFHIILKVLFFLCFSFNYLRKIHSELVGAENPHWPAGGKFADSVKERPRETQILGGS